MRARAPTVAFSMDPGGGGDPILAPVLLQHGPQRLIDVLAIAPNRAPQNSPFDSAEFPKRRIPSPVLKQHARFEPPRADHGEREGADQAYRFEEDTGAAG